MIICVVTILIKIKYVKFKFILNKLLYTFIKNLKEMNIRTSNTCFNCENLSNDLLCLEHKTKVDVFNVCDDHTYKNFFSKDSNCGNCMSFNTESCKHPSSATPGMLCIEWKPSIQ